MPSFLILSLCAIFVDPASLHSQEAKSAVEPATTKPTSNDEDTSVVEKIDYSNAGVTFSNPVRNRWQVGVKIKGGSRPASKMLITIPVPNEWPEQTVQVYEEILSNHVDSVKYRELNSGVKQLVATIPKVRANQIITMGVTFEVVTKQINAPSDPTIFEVPRKISKDIKDYLGVSPQISYRNAKLRKQVKALIEDKDSAWEKVETIYDWVKDNIEYRNSEPADCLSVFRKKHGCAEDLSGLFVAMCRSAKIPARMVFAEGNMYAEFYLVDPERNGHWFPCNVAGRRQFGSMVEPRIILQKGDNIKVPEKKERQKYCAEFVMGNGPIKPTVVFVRELLPAN
ncbi:MAG: transglutaminase domain-containing protein [Planctomycetota bacterium]